MTSSVENAYSGAYGAADFKDEWGQKLQALANKSTKAYDELREIKMKEDVDRLTKQRDADDAIASAVRATYDNEDGRLSDAQVKSINRNRGINVDGDGIQNGQIMEAGFNPKTGGYGLVFANVDGNGNVTYNQQEIPRTDLYAMMRNYEGWFTEDQMQGMADGIRKSDPSYSDEALQSLVTKYADERSSLDNRILGLQSGIRGGGRGGLTFEQRRQLQQDRMSGRFDKDRYSAISERLKSLRFEPDGITKRKMSEDELALESYLQGEQDAALGFKRGGGDGGKDDPWSKLLGGAKPSSAKVETKQVEEPKTEIKPKTEKPKTGSKPSTVVSQTNKGDEKTEPVFDPGAADPFHGLKSRIMRRLKKSDQEGEARRFDEMKSILDGTYHNGDITQGDIEKAKSYFKSKGVDVNDLQKKSEKKERTEKEISENPNDGDKLLLADGTTAQFDAKANEWKVVA